LAMAVEVFTCQPLLWLLVPTVVVDVVCERTQHVMAGVADAVGIGIVVVVVVVVVDARAVVVVVVVVVVVAVVVCSLPPVTLTFPEPPPQESSFRPKPGMQCMGPHILLHHPADRPEVADEEVDCCNKGHLSTCPSCQRTAPAPW